MIQANFYLGVPANDTKLSKNSPEIITRVIGQVLLVGLSPLGEIHSVWRPPHGLSKSMGGIINEYQWSRHNNGRPRGWINKVWVDVSNNIIHKPVRNYWRFYSIYVEEKLRILNIQWSTAIKPPATTQIPLICQHSERTDLFLLYLC